MSTIFISYRRETTAGEARALFSSLVARLGQDSVFMDVDGIDLGRDFRNVLRERIGSCDLVLVLIGRDWAHVKDEQGRIRLEDPDDFVRLEIESALKRDIVVTPVLVQGAYMPAAEQLPVEIRDITYRNGFELGHNRWESDVQEMIRRLGLRNSKPSPPPVVVPSGIRRHRVFLILCAGALLSAGLGVALVLRPQSSVFEHPTIHDLPLDWCYRPASECGQAAARAFCLARGYKDAKSFSPNMSSFTPDMNKVDRSFILGDGSICDLSRFRQCNTFATIRCD
jgi:hypothetical protein